MHKYPPSVLTQDQRNEFDNAFNEGESDNFEGCIRNDYERNTAGWYGYEAGWRFVEPCRQNFAAQTAYDDSWPSLPAMPAP